ncbi:alpha/beta fold hydrolase [Halomonas saccharevitans]|uniref:Alpha/beta fold hydrolase n=1 Tax=Halomonas saccharevitans TaxID=416872 RepID=A0ABU3NDB6_9GAMM|nr:alpha/beta fold hydrolase [Halomonas saccharevitans]MDT8878513.1 alpha/beta fold hydrolase [Halomonas saccharevitans]
MRPLVLLSGWGCDARIWRPLAAHWPNRREAGLKVSTPDWPGYATRPALDDPENLAGLAEAMAADLPEDAVWVGWSLGGLLAAALLDHLPTPRGLVLLGMGAHFCHPDGVSHEDLATFRTAFRRDPATTRAHFLRWQLRGEPSPRAAHRQLLELLGPEPAAPSATLAAGLGQLARLDHRHSLAAPPCPIWRIVGEHDPLLPPSDRDAADVRLADAGHCPMLSQPRALAECLAAIAEERAP